MAHGDDIRQAVGQPFSLLDEARLSLMVSELMGALPIGVMLKGDALPGKTARFNVTGSGGGTFDVPLAFDEAPRLSTSPSRPTPSHCAGSPPIVSTRASWSSQLKATDHSSMPSWLQPRRSAPIDRQAVPIRSSVL